MKTAKNVIVLTIITVLAGFLLGYVYDITKGPIADATEKAKQQAYRSVFSSADKFEEIKGFDADIATNGVSSAGIKGVSIDEALEAKDSSGSVLGYVITVTSSEGYGGDVKLSMGIANDGTLNGIEFLSLSETAGLGMNADTVEFKSQFSGLNAKQISYTKTGKQNDYEIDAISGATITTSAVTNAVNAGLSYFSAIAGGESNE
ncbi:MAG: RnfABCDGE type electron transport complex subunit G [Lachnospiraceae bacterium]|nr:RnfABCDGE type electron transport complex subunit G [Lachnospiraceae bacterium]